ncbi:MAG: hypothetical protein SNJ83_13675, partial [Aggregatilineales bacterium]
MQTACLLVRGGALPPIEELYELTANDVIESHIVDDHVVEYVVVWPEVRVRLRLREATTAQPL